MNEEFATPLEAIPQRARALTVFGNLSTKAMHDLYYAPQGSLFPPDDDPDFLELADALRKRKWDDASVALLIQAYGRSLQVGGFLDLKTIARWVLAHHSGADVQAVIDCMEIRPPEEIDIIKVLSRKGSQKIVFLASWRLRQQEVVLKKILGSQESVERILSRELAPHPLSMVHPNIIETHILKNSHGESFLVERKLQVVLSDQWRANGIHEAANLLFDIANALKFLHDNQRVHGDVKPDNIGKRGDHYVLLDFGICRPRSEFTPDASPTGSIRTRAPELLDSHAYEEPEKADVWALGATVYNAVLGRFPLISVKESREIPRVSSPEERKDFESMVMRRVRSEWSQWVTFDGIPSPLREILVQMLDRDVGARLSASDLVRRAEAELSAFLRLSSVNANHSGRFSPAEELDQIRRYMSAGTHRKLLPVNRRQQLAARLSDLRSVPGFDDVARRTIDDLFTQLT
jgi:serine/threonine protein kinase